MNPHGRVYVVTTDITQNCSIISWLITTMCSTGLQSLPRFFSVVSSTTGSYGMMDIHVPKNTSSNVIPHHFMVDCCTCTILGISQYNYVQLYCISCISVKTQHLFCLLPHSLINRQLRIEASGPMAQWAMQ